MWKLKSYTLRDGKTTIVKKWFSEQASEVQAAFLVRMKDLIKLPDNGWDRPDVGQLRGKECKGLYEIVLSANKVEHRPLGYFSGKMEFTIVAFAIEKGGKFIPPNICQTAKKRMNFIKQYEERVYEFTIN